MFLSAFITIYAYTPCLLELAVLSRTQRACALTSTSPRTPASPKYAHRNAMQRQWHRDAHGGGVHSVGNGNSHSGH